MTQILDFARCRAEKLYQQAVELEQEGDLDEALALLKQAVALDSSHADARVALSFHYRRIGQVDEALAHCQAAIRHAPSAEGYFSLGQALIDKSEHEAALTALRRALEYNPSLAPAQYKIAFVYYLRGDYDVAITEFHRAAQMDADWETYFFLGECYRLTRRCPEAERMFRRAMPLAASWGQVELTKAQLACVARLREFPQHAELSVKDRYYADSGTVYLGTGQDDGLQIHPYFFYHFSYTDIAITLKRLLTLIDAADWRFDAVAPVDIVSLPLALALAHRLGVATEPVPGGQTLLVQALGETVEALQDALDQAPGATTFCLAASWEEDWAPDLMGIHTPLPSSVPWYRLGALTGIEALAAGLLADRGRATPIEADPRPAETIATDILQAIDSTPDDPTLESQRVYYCEQHTKLRFV